MYYITKEFGLESGHFLRGYKGKCKRVHGHNYRVLVTLKCGALDGIGMIYDFGKLENMMKELIVKKYDHQLLNDIEPFDKINPTAENMSKVFYDIIKKGIESFSRGKSIPDDNGNVYEVGLEEVDVYENDFSYATFKI